MSYRVYTSLKSQNESVEVVLPKSKSIANRIQVLSALTSGSILADSLGTSKDVALLQEALASDSPIIDIQDAGTAARFYLALACLQNKAVEIKGSARMHERPIAPLVDALNELGFDIRYMQNKGFLPLQIHPVSLNDIKPKVEINSSISSQYVSALCLIAPFLPDGLSIRIRGSKTSWPYVEMTLNALKHFGVEVEVDSNRIDIDSKINLSGNITIEADWSAAAFIYQICACQAQSKITLKGLNQTSWQGDSKAIEFFKLLGVETNTVAQDIEIWNTGNREAHVRFDFTDCPDLAQPIIATCAYLGITGDFRGLQTLSKKETNRILALQTELQKVGASVRIGPESLHLSSFSIAPRIVHFESYLDHRMIMCLAPFSLSIKEVYFEEIKSVEKSFPSYWQEVDKLGIHLLHADSNH